MTVAELIAELSKLPQDSPVWVYDPDDPDVRDNDPKPCIRVGSVYL